MKSIPTLVLVLFSTSLALAQANSKYGNTLKTMFEVSGTSESYQAVIKQTMNMLKQQHAEVSAEVWNELEKEFLKTSLEDLVDLLVPVYSKYLDQNDLEKIINFYQTPAGKKLAGSTPLIMQESMQIGQQWGMKIGQEFEKKLRERGY